MSISPTLKSALCLDLPAKLGALIIVRESQCWEWQGTLNRDGYATYSQRLAHRLIYERLIGPIPAGLELDHTCRHRACVNPAHHEPVTRKINTLRSNGVTALNARKTHCPQGHPYSLENTYRDKRGSRYCRTCCNRRRVLRARRARARKADTAALDALHIAEEDGTLDAMPRTLFLDEDVLEALDESGWLIVLPTVLQ